MFLDNVLDDSRGVLTLNAIAMDYVDKRTKWTGLVRGHCKFKKISPDSIVEDVMGRTKHPHTL